MMRTRLFERVYVDCLVLGTVERDFRNWVARGPDWQELGTFKTRHEAVDAVWTAHIINPGLALFCAEAASVATH